MSLLMLPFCYNFRNSHPCELFFASIGIAMCVGNHFEEDKITNTDEKIKREIDEEVINISEVKEEGDYCSVSEEKHNHQLRSYILQATSST